MDEFRFIDSIKPSYYRQSSVIKGVGDDGAVIQPNIGHELVISTDTMVDQIHFNLNNMSLEDVGYRVMVANISDLAAMGSSPLYYIVNISAPNSVTNEDLLYVYQGMNDIASQYRMDLIGGDTTSGHDLVISVTVFGNVSPKKKRLRSSAQIGDIVFTTGYLGEAGYGLSLLDSHKHDKLNYFVQRHIRPQPRVDFVRVTTNVNRICLNDVSDGISSELNEIANASNVSIEIDWDKVPIHKDMNHLEHSRLKQLALSAGEDFELVGTCSKGDWKLVRSLCEKDDIKVTEIGKVINRGEEPSVYLNEFGEKLSLDQSGYQHGNS
ncbi:thiamine-phosphate kinase [Aquisalibacillus elongatus]|uniref:Thiamine-monophosphate kinase n=1 Tax=Aquisalibacillus elongatus TaxID=485577 RepID=A0A3N5BPQ3_9BACI|nr:thiamine-phosphate kinase [Aquisalibacillus elongatus]RPF57050.1 thiamine-phosphate kinase [Aquisalibacillus elongatus]